MEKNHLVHKLLGFGIPRLVLKLRKLRRILNKIVQECLSGIICRKRLTRNNIPIDYRLSGCRVNGRYRHTETVLRICNIEKHRTIDIIKGVVTVLHIRYLEKSSLEWVKRLTGNSTLHDRSLFVLNLFMNLLTILEDKNLAYQCRFVRSINNLYKTAVLKMTLERIFKFLLLVFGHKSTIAVADSKEHIRQRVFLAFT